MLTSVWKYYKNQGRFYVRTIGRTIESCDSGLISRGAYIQGGLYPGGLISRGAYIQGGL